MRSLRYLRSRRCICRVLRSVSFPGWCLPLLCVTAIGSLSTTAQAQTSYTWDPGAANVVGGADGSGAWDTATQNWYTTAGGDNQLWANVASTSANNAIFGEGGTGSYTVTLGNVIDVGTMTFQSMGAGGNYTIGTSSTASLTIYGGISLTSGAGPVTINSSSGTGLVFGANNTWTNNSASLLTVSSNITDSTFGLTIAGTGSTTISGALLGGSGGVTMNGFGTLTLSGGNTYTGSTTVNAGTLSLTGSIAGTTNTP